MIKGLEPIIDEHTKVLILGSMPSITSLDIKEYYGFKYNRFWKIMHDVYQLPIDSYSSKLQLLKKHNIGVWDIIGECQRTGSLDSNIKNIKVNPINEYLFKFDNIMCIICNGQKSYQTLIKFFPDINIQVIALPSTSNANRSILEEELFVIWEKVLRSI